MSKGSRRRLSKVSMIEGDLRWELINSTTTEARKEQILLQLKQLSIGLVYCPTNPSHTVELTPCKELGVYNCKFCAKTYRMVEK